MGDSSKEEGFFCFTSWHNSELWEYCAPSSQLSVKKLTHTVNGQECVGDCGTHGEKYWWCKKPQRWPPKSGKGGSNGDSTWDYCSPDFHTRYNKPCKDACEGRGEDYFWCHTTDNSWDYCSPKAVEPVIARGGRPCVGICDYMGQSYEWCNVWNAGYSGNWWDYCGEGTEAAWKSWIPTIIIIATVILVVIVCFASGM